MRNYGKKQSSETKQKLLISQLLGLKHANAPLSIEIQSLASSTHTVLYLGVWPYPVTAPAEQTARCVSSLSLGLGLLDLSNRSIRPRTATRTRSPPQLRSPMRRQAGKRPRSDGRATAPSSSSATAPMAAARARGAHCSHCSHRSSRSSMQEEATRARRATHHAAPARGVPAAAVPDDARGI